MKKHLLLTINLLCAIGLLFLSNGAVAQKNIAPDAAVTCQTTSGLGCWNLNRINDRDYGTCGGQQAFVWSAAPPASSDHIQWEWTTRQTFNEVVVYHAQTTGRFLAGCKLQYWDGTTFRDIGTFSLSQANCENTMKFTPVSTTRLRLTEMTPGTGQQSNLNYREIDIIQSFVFNAGVTDIGPATLECSVPTDIVAHFSNLGIDRIDSVDLWWSIDGSVPQLTKWNSGASHVSADSLRAGRTVEVPVVRNYTFSPFNTYDLKIWSSMPNGKADTINEDDTIRYVIDFKGTPNNPTVTNTERCGVGTVTMQAQTSDSRDDVYWYPTQSSLALVGRGVNAESPFYYASDTVWAQAARPSPLQSLSTGYSNAATIVSLQEDEEGGFLAFRVGAKPIVVDSMIFALRTSSNVGYHLFYREGGISTNPNDWIRIKNEIGTTVSVGATAFRLPVRLNEGLTLEANKTYTFYFAVLPSQGLSNDVSLAQGTRTRSDRYLSVEGGTVSLGRFGAGGTFTLWTIDVSVVYSYACMSSTRIPLAVTIKEQLQEAELTQGSTFDGYFRRGISSNPDLTTEFRTLNYEVKAPSGTSNGTYGTDWSVSSVTFTSTNGTPVPSADFSNAGANSSTNASITYSPSAGWEDSTVMMTVAIRNLANGCDTLLTRYIYISPIPTASFDVTSVCLGEVTEFGNQSSVLKGFLTYEWDFGDGDVSDFTDPVHVFKAAGTYNVSLRVTTDWGFSHDTTISVVVNEIPNIAYRVLNACEGNKVEFVNSTTIVNGSRIDYSWDFGDGNGSTMESPSHEYATPGGYRVTLVATSNGCASRLTKNANQFAKPEAKFSSTGVCQGAPIQFNNNSTISTTDFVGVMWTFEPNQFATVNNPTYVFGTSGTKTIKMIATSQFNCQDSIEQTVTIAPGPVADFSFGQVCNLDPTTFVNTSTEPQGLLYVYDWNFGDGTSSSQRSPSKLFPSLGERIVTLTIDASNNCKSSISKTVDVKLQPDAKFDVAGACAGESVDFRNLTTIAGGRVIYTWNFGDGSSSSDVSPKKVYTPSTTTTYNVELVANIEGGCSDTAREVITINETPVCGYTFTSTGRGWGREWVFSPANKTYGANAYTWLIEGQGVYTEMEPTVVFTEPSRYRIKLLINSQDGCSCLDSLGTINIADAIAGVRQSAGAASLVKIYPNPSTGIFTVAVEVGKGTIQSLIITDLSGRVVDTRITAVDAQNYHVDGSTLSSGVYMIQVLGDQGWSTHRMNISR